MNVRNNNGSFFGGFVRPWSAHGLRERGDTWAFEKLAQRQLDFEDSAHPRDDLRRQERLAAKLEKVVVNADWLDAKQLLPDAGDDLLGFVARCDEFHAQIRPRMKRDGRARLAFRRAFESAPEEGR